MQKNRGLKEINTYNNMRKNTSHSMQKNQTLNHMGTRFTPMDEYAFLPEPTSPYKIIKKALKGYTKSFEFGIVSKLDPLYQLNETQKDISTLLKSELEIMNGLKFTETIKVTFEKQLDNDNSTFKSAYFNSKVKTITNKKQMANELKKSSEEILKTIGVWLSEGSGWTFESIDGHFVNIVKYQPLNGSSYIELPKELQNSAKGLINIKNNDDECFKWCHIRHMNPQKKNPQRIKKIRQVNGKASVFGLH